MFELQLILVGLIVLAAAGYLVRASWRTWKGGKKGCGGGCACSPSAGQAPEERPVLIPVDQLTLRRRDARSSPEE